jgi:hypothetical protein
MAEQDDSYEIGYKKPPAETRFTRGQSGNPKGRPKGAKNLATLLVKVGRERVRVTINGRTRTITKLEAILLQLANKAISGEDRAAKEILHLLSLYEDSDKTGLPQADQDEKEEATWENFVQRILKSNPGSDDGTGGAPAAISDWKK